MGVEHAAASRPSAQEVLAHVQQTIPGASEDANVPGMTTHTPGACPGWLHCVVKTETIAVATLLNIADAQRDMRFAYFSGAPGVFASAVASLVAGAVAALCRRSAPCGRCSSAEMFIFPVRVVIAKILGRPGAHSRGNPFGALAMEGTVLLMVCLPLAFVVSLYSWTGFFRRCCW